MSSFLHIWQADLIADYPSWAVAEATLSPAELGRQARLRTATLRQTFGRAHGFLRAVLAVYTSQAARLLAFSTTDLGKPQLPDTAIHFSLSYRPGRALLAVSNAASVGADVEPLRPLADAAALVADLFSPTEQAALRAAPPEGWWPLFYTIWTRKEAYAKALGMGLTMPFAGFSVLAPPCAGPVVLTAPPDASLHSFAAGAGYQGPWLLWLARCC
ncbi:4'-phosphopantetheinyl transferase superfamily protein [Hymenobacter sp. BRD128]|uniref:4'-phosphopantetheinyl transferase family protein n=1 Tax=Hymenobacter sp. BRD128 TaxID=2675878 RepID=UPI0015676CE3|nr:4'-phosphopantetheinyl transferase superfamily protein [Hymenobacter sp. BRD128]QKG55793.1 4'-phosphopantetheinyl transferase superfamily protein [Hymenobacter sp. BRD128]